MDIEKAIDVLKELEEIYGSPNPFKDDKDYDRAVAIKTVLNELDNKDKIILREKLERQMSEEADKKILEFKDKIINEMGEKIYYLQDEKLLAGYSKQEVIDYFTKKVEEK